MTIPSEDDLNNFIDFLFDGLEGYVYVVARVPKQADSWDQVFFEWPAQKNQMIKAINTYSPTHEIYMAPAIFGSKNATKENVKATNVLWTEFDGNTPSSFDIPPSMVIRSSTEGHEHVYWRLDEPLTEIQTIEDFNRRICYKYGADNSAWDATQVLRPPYTLNHKRGSLPVSILSQETNLNFNLSVFEDLAPAPEKTVDYSLWEKLDLPSLNDVIYRNKFGPDFKILFEKTKEEVKDRSTTLTNMAFVCAEAGLNDKEIYVIISHLADRWEKFTHHTKSSRARQLISIIEHTRIKYPNDYSDLDQVFEYSPKALLETDIKIEWAIPNMLMRRGVMVLGGESGIGKTQLSMQFMFHLAMGKDFLTYKLTKPLKIGFISLEMGDLEVKAFLEIMYPELIATCTPEQINLLNQNLQIIPFGEAIPLNTSHGQDIITSYQEKNQWDGIFIDSLGTAVFGNINSTETVQPVLNFNDKLRKRYGCFLWYIHHFRKPAPGTKNYGDKADLYGDQYITARATSVYSMVKGKNGLLRIRNPKQRLAKEEPDYYIRRDPGLMFSYHGEANPDEGGAISIVKKQLHLDEDNSDPNPFKDKK